MIKKIYQSNKNPHSWLISPAVCGFAELGYRLLFGGLCLSPWGRQWALGSLLCEGAASGVSALGRWRWRLCGPCRDCQTPGAGPFTPASPFTEGASLAAIRLSHPLRTGWAGILGNTHETKCLSQGAPGCSSLCSADPGPRPWGLLNVAPALVASATLQAPRPWGLRASTRCPQGYPPHPDQLGLAHRKPFHERTLPHLFSQHAPSVPNTHTGCCMPL